MTDLNVEKEISKICTCDTGNICDTRCMKLKEAEKTIANKDVIIKMLQEHVKKLETSYRDNIKETEKFRYKFFLASEQMKRLKGANLAEKCDTQKLKQLKCDLNKWNEQKTLIEKNSSEFSGKCKYLEQLKNMENFMKAHYELLQALVDKVLQNKSNESTDINTAEMNIKHDEQILKLEQEISRLKEENKKLHKQKHEEKTVTVKSKTCSIKTSSGKLHKKSTEIKEYTSSHENLSKEASQEAIFLTVKEPTQYHHESYFNEINATSSGKLSNKCCKPKEQISSQKNLQEDKPHEAISSTVKEPPEYHHSKESYLNEINAASSGKLPYKCCKPKEQISSQTNLQDDEQHEAFSTVKEPPEYHHSKETYLNELNAASSGKLPYKCCKPKEQISSQKNLQDDEQHEAFSTLKQPPEYHHSKESYLNEINTASSGNLPKKMSEATEPTSSPKNQSKHKETSFSAVKDPMHYIPSQESYLNEMNSLNFVLTPSEMKPVDPSYNVIERTHEQYAVKINDTMGSEPVKNTSEVIHVEEYKEEVEYINMSSVPPVSNQSEHITITKFESEKKISKHNGDNSEEQNKIYQTEDKHKKSITSSNVSKHSELQDSHQAEKTDINNDVVSKLCDISQTVKQLLNNQEFTCDELKSLKNQLESSRDTTQQCTDNISKLAKTIDDQKETFMEKFEEQKNITNNLATTNDNIQHELVNIKSNIDELYRNIDTLKRTSKSSVKKSAERLAKKNSSSSRSQASDQETKSNNSNTIEVKKEKSEEKKDESHQVEIITDDDLDALEKISEQKDIEIENINHLITCYQAANEHISSINSKDSGGSCPCDHEGLESYLNKVKFENIKMKTTISSVIDHLNEKMIELKNSESECQYTSMNELCICEESSSCRNPPVSQVKKSDLEIEDIYNAIRKSCGCNKKDMSGSGVTSQSDDDYKCVFCACSSHSTFNGPSNENSKKNDDSKCDATINLHQTESMGKTMESYIQYLHEQLETINSIENRIEDLRNQVQL